MPTRDRWNPLDRWSRAVSVAAELVAPLRCAGCGAGQARWCDRCARTLADVPFPVPQPIGVPCWAVASHRGAPREAVLALKERGRRDLCGPLGAALATAATTLMRWGELEPGAIWVPAPTTRVAARARGGDVVLALCPAGRRWPGLITLPGGADAVGLTRDERADNIAGRIRVARRAVIPTGPLLLVDDVVTSGATLAEAVRVLRAVGARPVAALVLTAA